jgi:hypothetical protein
MVWESEEEEEEEEEEGEGEGWGTGNTASRRRWRWSMAQRRRQHRQTATVAMDDGVGTAWAELVRETSSPCDVVDVVPFLFPFPFLFLLQELLANSAVHGFGRVVYAELWIETAYVRTHGVEADPKFTRRGLVASTARQAPEDFALSRGEARAGCCLTLIDRLGWVEPVPICLQHGSSSAGRKRGTAAAGSAQFDEQLVGGYGFQQKAIRTVTDRSQHFLLVFAERKRNYARGGQHLLQGADAIEIARSEIHSNEYQVPFDGHRKSGVLDLVEQGFKRFE